VLEKTKSFCKRFSNRIRNSIMLRVTSTAIFVSLLLILTTMIEDLIRERQTYQQQAILEVSSSWAGAQTIADSVLPVPYRTVFRIGSVQEQKTHCAAQPATGTDVWFYFHFAATGRLLAAHWQYRAIYPAALTGMQPPNQRKKRKDSDNSICKRMPPYTVTKRK